jgi:hypothetical protein
MTPKALEALVKSLQEKVKALEAEAAKNQGRIKVVSTRLRQAADVIDDKKELAKTFQSLASDLERSLPQ